MENKPVGARRLVSWWSHPRFIQARPMLIDTAVPTVCYYVLHSWLGADAIIALAAAAVILTARVVLTVVRERRIDSFQTLILVSTLVALLLAFLIQDPRIVLLRTSVVSAVLGLGCVATTFVGRPLLEKISRPGLLLMFPDFGAAWENCWAADARFRTRVRQINLLQGFGFLAGSVTRVWMVFHTSLGVAVITSGLPGMAIAGVVTIATAVLATPLISALDKARKEEQPLISRQEDEIEPQKLS